MFRLVAFGLASLAGAAEPLQGKVAFITGASSGIGAVVAREFAKHGVKVVLTARRKEKLSANVDAIKGAGGEAAAFSCDVSNGTSVADAFAFAEKTYGGVDFVFANAGIEGPGTLVQGLVDQDDDAHIQAVFDINSVGAVHTLKHAVKAFEKKKGGTIAFSSSILSNFGEHQKILSSFGGPPGNLLTYTASKAAVDMIVEAAHGSFADQGVKVFNLNIGMFWSEIQERVGGKEDGDGAFNPIFKCCMGNPKSIADVLLAILDGSSKWPAGSHFVVDNDATFDAKHLFDTRKKLGSLESLGWPSPEELKPFAKDVRGEPYNFTEVVTSAVVSSSQQAIGGQKAEL